MRLLRSPVTQFLLIGILTVAGIAMGVNYFAGRAAADEATAEARRTTEVLAQSVARPDIPAGLAKMKPGAIDRFDRSVLKRLLINDPAVVRVNIWSSDGTLIYSNETDLIGGDFKLDHDQRRVLAEGGTGSTLTDSRTSDNPLTAGTEGLVQTYTQIKLPNDQLLLFEAFYSPDEIEKRQRQIFTAFRWITLGPVLLLMAVVTVMLTFLTRQLTSASAERERLLRAAIDASDAERRRIARDLHDGVVQDLAGTAFSVSAVARAADTPAESRALLDGASGSLRDGLKALRSLLAEIHPPDFHADGLAAALADLIAPASTAGIAASVSTEGAETASDAMAALVWRVAQEAVRNAIRHSRASTLAVTVRGDGKRLALEVVDDGIGFDPEVRDPDRFGLRGLRSLVAECNGVLEVRSSPGEGTTVRMEVDAT